MSTLAPIPSRFARCAVKDPLIGRFVSADPVIPESLGSQGINRYSYVGNNPLSMIDESGFEPDASVTVTGSRDYPDARGNVGSFSPSQVGSTGNAAKIAAAEQEANANTRNAPLTARPPETQPDYEVVMEAPTGSLIKVSRLRPRSGGNVRSGQRAVPKNSAPAKRYIPGGSLARNETFPNAHVLREHVGRTPSQLRQRMREENLKRTSSFRNREEAERARWCACLHRAAARPRGPSSRQP